MICVRTDLIYKELNDRPDRTYQKLKPSSRFIDWLFNHYYTAEFAECYYDSEPDIPYEWSYRFDIFRNPEFLKVWTKLKEEHEPHRIEFCNWIELHFEGNWDVSQFAVDSVARNSLKYVRKTNVKKDGRLWIAYEDDYIFIYWYGRDFMEVDYWWVMKRR